MTFGTNEAPGAAPRRLMLSRRGGSNLQAASLAANGRRAVNVARPSAWGNHVPVQKMEEHIARVADHDAIRNSDQRLAAYLSADAKSDDEYALLARETAVAVFAIEMRKFRRTDPGGFEDFISPLRGLNLACWCKPDQSCHADVLLEMANAGPHDVSGFAYTPLGRERR